MTLTNGETTVSNLKDSTTKKVFIRGRFYGDRTLPSLNDYLREIGRHPKAGGRMKKDYMWVCISAIRRDLKGYKVTNPPIVLHYKYFEEDKGIKRDISNIHALCAKFFEDALQTSGVIENDNPAWIKHFDCEFHWIKGEPYIEIEIEETANIQSNP